MVMCLAVGQSAFLVVTMAQKWLLTLGAHEMLDVPVLAQRRHHTLLDRPTACTANRYAHFVVAPQAIQFVNVVGRKTRTTFDFASRRIELGIARRTVEVVAVVDFVTESQWSAVDNTATKIVQLEKRGFCLSGLTFLRSLRQ